MPEKAPDTAKMPRKDDSSGESLPSHETQAQEVFKYAKDLYTRAIEDFLPLLELGWRIEEVRASIHDIPLFDLHAEISLYPESWIDENPERVLLLTSGKERAGRGHDVKYPDATLEYDAEGFRELQYLDGFDDTPLTEALEMELIAMQHMMLKRMMDASDESLQFSVKLFGRPDKPSDAITTDGVDSSREQLQATTP